VGIETKECKKTKGSRNEIHETYSRVTVSWTTEETETFLEELKVHPVENKLPWDTQKGLNYVSRMEDIRYPKQFLDYRPIGKRRPG
jgi:hypothetical protein